MAQLLLIGGHGKVALLAIPLLVADGHTVSAVIRNPAHSEEVAAAGAIPVLADVETMDAAALAGLTAGHDVLIWSAGAGGGDPARTYAVDRDAAIRSMAAASQTGVDRYVMVSYFGAGPGHGVPETDGFYPYAQAKAAADAHLRDSGLDWVILGPSRLTLAEPSGLIEVAHTADAAKGSVSRGNVAQVLAAVVNRPGISRTTVEFNDGPTPIDAALDQVD